MMNGQSGEIGHAYHANLGFGTRRVSPPFPFAQQKQLMLDVHQELIVDLFAGGGGMSTGFEMTLGRSPDIAINHSDDALSMHRMNHPQCRHFIADVYEVDPRAATQGRPVGWLHLSPDCTHHSQAAGGQPRSKKIRGLSWVGFRWAAQVSPRVISLENVPQIEKWGPLVAKRDKATGRVVKLDKTVAAPGERVPVQEQFLVPDPKRAGRTWKRFIRSLQGLGYDVKVDVSIAADLGGHTSRTRLFMIARRDGVPIVLPERTYFKKPGKGKLKWRPAADCIDWSIACPSIFRRKKPLAAATQRRIAKGIQKYVLQSATPFIVPIAHYNGRDVAHPVSEPLRTITAATKGGEFALASPMVVMATHQGGDRVNDIADPLPTVTAAHRGEMMLATPVIAKFRGSSPGAAADDPLPTITSGGDCVRPAGAAHALGLIAPTLVQAAHGDGKPGGVQRWGDGARDITDPLGTVTASGGHAIAAATLVQTGYGEREGQSPRALDIGAPLGTVVGSQKHAVVSAALVGVRAPAPASAAYILQANGGNNTNPGHSVLEPMSTVTNTGSQQQLVTAHLAHLRGNCDARDVTDPLMTVSAGGEHHGVVSAFLSRQFGGSVGHAADAPMGTTTAGGGGKSALVAATLITNTTGHAATDLSEPTPTVATGGHHAVASAFLSSYYSDESDRCRPLVDPTATITTENRLGLVECILSPADEARALRVAEFLIQHLEMDEGDRPTSKQGLLALVTVMVEGVPYVIVDIGLRMLQPQELFRAQDFPDTYIIDRGHDGRIFSKSTQVRLVGNSVDPVQAAAYIRANAAGLAVRRMAA